MEITVQEEVIERKIYLIRGHKVMLDSDLAELYRVATKVLIQAVKRNVHRFPPDFMFQLNNQEVIVNMLCEISSLLIIISYSLINLYRHITIAIQNT